MSVADLFTITANLNLQTELNRQQADRDQTRADMNRAQRTTSNNDRCATCGHGEYTHQRTDPTWCGRTDCACRAFAPAEATA